MKLTILAILAVLLSLTHASEQDPPAYEKLVSFFSTFPQGEDKEALAIVFYPDHLRVGIGFTDERIIRIDELDFEKAKSHAIGLISKYLQYAESKNLRPKSFEKDQRFHVSILHHEADLYLMLEYSPNEMLTVISFAEELIGEGGLLKHFSKKINEDNQSVDTTAVSAPH